MKYKGYTIKIKRDEHPSDPREFDCLGKMVCFHPKYILGDKGHGLTPHDLVEKVKGKDILALPLFLLDHSGLSIQTEPFGCDPQGWDTSRLGYIYVDGCKARKELGGKSAWREKALRILEAEVFEYNQYLIGDVHGFIVFDRDGKEVSSCCGFIGDPEKSGLINEAKAVVDADLKKAGIQLELFPELKE